MRRLPTKWHGLLDYLVSALVIALPFLAGWQSGARWWFVALGCLGVGYSLITDYEWGAVRLLPMPMHLILDAAFGVAMLMLAATLDLGASAWAPAVIGGLALLLVVITERWPHSSPHTIRSTTP